MSDSYDQVFNKPGDNPGGKATSDDNDDVFVEMLGKKWSKDEVVKKVEHSESFINTLKKELEEAKDKLSKSTEFEDILEALKNKDSKDTSTTNDVNPDDLVKKTLSLIEERDRSRIAQKNFEQVEAKMKQKFGDDYVTKAGEVAKSMGMTADTMKSLMQDSPGVIESLFKLDTDKPSASPTTSSVNSVGVGVLNNEQVKIEQVKTAKESFRKGDTRNLQVLFDYYKSKKENK